MGQVVVAVVAVRQKRIMVINNKNNVNKPKLTSLKCLRNNNNKNKRLGEQD